MNWKIENNNLLYHNDIVLKNIPSKICVESDSLENGVFIQTIAEKAEDLLLFNLGEIFESDRFMSCFRPRPLFMHATAGDNLKDIPEETLCLLIKRNMGDYLILLPIIDEIYRSSLKVDDKGNLILVAESGDQALMHNKATVLFAAVGDDPYVLMEKSAKSIMDKIKTGRLRVDKPVPEFVDYLGWCTYNAFYWDVNHEKYCSGLENFKKGNIQLGFTILDDGWQSVSNEKVIGQRKLTSFEADCGKFPKGISYTVKHAKENYGINKFIVWHAALGYWAGIDKKSLYKYSSSETLMEFSKGTQEHGNNIKYPHSIVKPDSIYAFYNDYHNYMRTQGIDGVKIDTQYVIEGLSHQVGGRINAMKTYHAALESSSNEHFKGELLNCMSCSNDMLYCTINSNLIRSSEDFHPNKPGTYGEHVQANAYASFWIGEFSYADWDMFWSKHSCAAFQAMARVVGGSPIYISDELGNHDFELLHKLVLSDGTILRPQRLGRPTMDCLFHNPLKEDILLKIFNTNQNSGVIGVFNVQKSIDKKSKLIKGSIKPSDIPGFVAEQYAVYRFGTGEFKKCNKDAEFIIELKELESEIYTIVPIDNGIAPIGLVGKYNSGGAVVSKGFNYYGDYSCILRDGGTFAAWSELRPKKVIVNGLCHEFEYQNNTLKVNINSTGHQELLIIFE